MYAHTIQSAHAKVDRSGGDPRGPIQKGEAEAKKGQTQGRAQDQDAKQGEQDKKTSS